MGAPSKLCLGGIARTPIQLFQSTIRIVAPSFRVFMRRGGIPQTHVRQHSTHHETGCPTLATFLFLWLGWDRWGSHPGCAWVGSHEPSPSPCTLALETEDRIVGAHPPCQDPAAKINLQAFRKSFLICSLSSDLFSSKFADYISGLDTLVLYAANLPTRHHAFPTRQPADPQRVLRFPDGTKPGSPVPGSPICLAIKTAHFRPSEIEENKQI